MHLFDCPLLHLVHDDLQFKGITMIPILDVIHNAFESNSALPYPRDKEVRSTEVAKALENLQHGE